MLSSRFVRNIGLIFRQKSSISRVGPGLKDFIASSQQGISESGDSQWDEAPYLQDQDVAAKGRKGELNNVPRQGLVSLLVQHF